MAEELNKTDKIIEETRDERSEIFGYKWITKEIIIGIIFISIGILIIFNNILKVELDIRGLFSIISFTLGIWNHIRFFQDNEKLNQLILGHLLMLLSLLFAKYLLSSMALNIFVFFILFQIMAVSILAYTIRTDLNWLLVVSFVVLIIIALNVISEDFALKLRDTIILWAIAIFFLYLHNLKKNKIFLVLSIFFLIIGFHEVTTIGENIFEVLIIWFFATAFIYYYLRKPTHWWPIIPAGLLILAGYETINTSIIRILPSELTASFWLLGIGGIFFIIWLLKDKYKDTGWAIWPAVILWIIAIIVAITEYLDSELIIPLFLVLLGSWLIARKVRPLKKK